MPWWDIVYLDFSKAFDTVSHCELMSKLYNLGVHGDGDLWRWLQCYLQDRQQCVCLSDARSATLPVLSGVPQGSVLRPLLFLAYINDLPDHVSSLLYMYAHDLKCARPISSHDDGELLQADLNSLCSWEKQWRMTFKVSKCAVLQCITGKTSPVNSEYELNGVVMKTSDTYKDLGVFFSADLSFTTHYNYITSWAYRMLGLIRQTFTMKTNVQQKKSPYISLVGSQLLYCSVLWRPNLLRDIELLERVQRRATKHILNDFRSNYKSRLLVLNLLPLMYILEPHDVMFAVACLKSSHKEFDILNFIKFSSQTTRSSSQFKLVHQQAYSRRSRHFYFNRLPTKIWNSLPPIDLELPYKSIRRRLRNHLRDHFTRNFDSHWSCTFH